MDIFSRTVIKKKCQKSPTGTHCGILQEYFMMGGLQSAQQTDTRDGATGFSRLLIGVMVKANFRKGLKVTNFGRQ